MGIQLSCHMRKRYGFLVVMMIDDRNHFIFICITIIIIILYSHIEGGHEITVRVSHIEGGLEITVRFSHIENGSEISVWVSGFSY